MESNKAYENLLNMLESKDNQCAHINVNALHNLSDAIAINMCTYKWSKKTYYSLLRKEPHLQSIQNLQQSHLSTTENVINKCISVRVTHNTLKLEVPYFRYVEYKYRAANDWNSNFDIRKAVYDAFKTALKKTRRHDKINVGSNQTGKALQYNDYNLFQEILPKYFSLKVLSVLVSVFFFQFLYRHTFFL